MHDNNNNDKVSFITSGSDVIYNKKDILATLSMYRVIENQTNYDDLPMINHIKNNF